MSKPQTTRLKRLESLVSLISAATTTLSAPKQGIQVLRTTIAGAQTINVPAATGESGGFDIYIGVTATGNKVIKAAGTTLFQGVAIITSAGTPGTFGTASNSNTITLNGTTLGGILGTRVRLRDVAVGVYHAEVLALGSGTAATPFSNT